MSIAGWLKEIFVEDNANGSMGFNVVTITGASGFVGRNIQDYLNVSYRIKPLSFVTYLTKKLFGKVTLYHLCWKAMQKRCLIHPNITKL
jgi:hypothetical protein